MQSKCVTLIIPCYNEQESLPYFYSAVIDIANSLTEYQFEIIFVNDGSNDGTLHSLREISKDDDRITYLSLSRNFGKEAAMYAGFCNAHGDYIAVMDADMQDPPSLLPKMIKILESREYDSVATRRLDRDGEPPIRSFFAKLFYKIINKISDASVMDGARDFRLMKREMVQSIISMSEYNRFSKGIFGWIGFKTYWLPYENVERVAGNTKWSFWKLFQYSIEGIINFSQFPLKLASWGGISLTGISFIMIIFIIIRKILFGDEVTGWTSLVCIITFIGGVQLFCMGIMGQYIAKTYMETKKRPHFIVAETNSDEVIKIR
ncbi:glycosyltransferase family 2 protein [Clostridium sp. SHJSY1]|uniref:glycosyltransferase family 2 protein n=1 Tax=Clostridium sp. SHJSY1 TaxID=2942483 RepID=UPI0028760402|nr:glycosyltransferase family 2 protein [Clostridium sp. SHJSY1]MDS0525876.1 glycosyltransferase family 2 protein [Clostridium sp. SHJSY1]